MKGLASDVENSAAALSAAEVARALEGLTAGEKTRLARIAKLYARTTSYGHEDLIHEAYVRILDRRREWPRGVTAVPFFAGVMRSIAWEWKADAQSELLDLGDQGAQERGTAAKIDLVKIAALFEDDPAAQKMVAAMMDGARGEELQEACGLNQTDYESKRKKIRRRIEKLFG